MVDAGQLDQAPSLSLLHSQSFLTLPQVSDRESFGQVGVDELLALLLEALQAPSLVDEQLRVVLPLLRHLLEGRCVHQLGQIRCELSASPVLEDVFLREIGRQIGQLTVGALLVAPQAVEVQIGAAPALGVGEAEARLAPRTEECSLEIMVVPPRAVAGDTPAGEHFLNVLPGLVINQSRMAAIVIDAAKKEPSFVVRAAQDPMDLASAQRHGRPGCCRPSSHPAPGQLFYEVGD